MSSFFAPLYSWSALKAWFIESCNDSNQMPSRPAERVVSKRANIQAMSPHGGDWLTVGHADNQADGGYLLTLMMENSQRQFPDHRIRAVTDDGRLIDML